MVVEIHTCGRPVAHDHLLVLVLCTFRDIFSQDSVCGVLDVRIIVVTLGNNVDDQPLQVPILLIVF